MALSEKADALDTYSEQVRDVLSRPPAGIVRRGTALLVGVVGLLALLSGLIRYPETLRGNVIISTVPTPNQVVVQRTGRLARLLSPDGSLVKPAQVLAELENTTRLANVPRLRAYTQAVRRFLLRPEQATPQSVDSLTFGDLQNDVNVIRKQTAIYQRLRQDDYLPARLRLLNQEISYYNQLVSINQQQEVINRAEFVNAEKKYAMDTRLYGEKVYSQAEFLSYENTYLQKKKENETYRKTFIENRLTLAGKEKERLDITQSHRQEVRAAFDVINESLQNCDNLLQNWQQTYLLATPTAGRLYWLRPLQTQQQVRPGDTLFTVIPQTYQLVGLATIPATNRGKLKLGQSVLIRLSDYPAEEYGMVQGLVESIALSPDNNQCRVKVALSNRLRTTFGRVLPYRPDLPGTVEIVTEDLSLLERALYGLRRIVRRS